MASAASGSHVKGASIRSFLRWYERTHEWERVLRAVALVPAADRHLLDPSREALGVLASTWYPSELVHALVDGMTDGLSEAELQKLADDGAQVIISEGLAGVYKMLFNLLITPERYAKNANRIWRMFHDSGTTQVAVVGPKEHRARITDWRGHHPFLCRLNRASTGQTYLTMKCRPLSLTDEECISRGDPACVFGIAWRGV